MNIETVQYQEVNKKTDIYLIGMRFDPRGEQYAQQAAQDGQTATRFVRRCSRS